MSNEAGKGSKRRQGEDLKKLRKNWPFAPKTVKLWERDEEGKLK